MIVLPGKAEYHPQTKNIDIFGQWPSNEDLTKESLRYFILVSAPARFIESEQHEPNKRLQLIMNLSESTVHEGRASVDPLCTQDLLLAFSDFYETTVFEHLRRVLAVVVLVFNPLSAW